MYTYMYTHVSMYTYTYTCTYVFVCVWIDMRFMRIEGYFLSRSTKNAFLGFDHLIEASKEPLVLPNYQKLFRDGGQSSSHHGWGRVQVVDSTRRP